MQESPAADFCSQVINNAIPSYIDRRAGLSRSGNWCGHRPDAPRFFVKPAEHKARPKILVWAGEAWHRFYSAPKAHFKEVRIARRSQRQQRSESREAMASIAEVILHYTELASLRVGVPHKTDGFRSLTIEFLAKKAGIGLKRAQRALALMKRAGYVKLIERFDIKDEKFIGLAAVKSLTPAFFKSCGINLQALSAQRRLARKRLNKKRRHALADAQERAAPVNILDFITPTMNSKAHVDMMRSFLKVDENSGTSRTRRKAPEI